MSPDQYRGHRILEYKRLKLIYQVLGDRAKVCLQLEQKEKAALYKQKQRDVINDNDIINADLSLNEASLEKEIKNRYPDL